MECKLCVCASCSIDQSPYQPLEPAIQVASSLFLSLSFSLLASGVRLHRMAQDLPSVVRSGRRRRRRCLAMAAAFHHCPLRAPHSSVCTTPQTHRQPTVASATASRERRCALEKQLVTIASMLSNLFISWSHTSLTAAAVAGASPNKAICVCF